MIEKLGVTILGACLVAFAIQSPLCAAESDETVRILFVGNSYTGQVRKAVVELIEASPHGKTTELEFITPGGKNLAFHLAKEATVQRITDGDWDFVVLQDQSQTPAVYPDRFEGAAIELDKLIDSSGATTVFYQTWGRRDGDKRNGKRFPTYESMQQELSGNYTKVARRCDALLAAVGDAWARVRRADDALGRKLYRDDGSHPSAKGAYLAASVFYQIFFGEPAVEVDFQTGVSEGEADVIHAAIAEALAD
jgi:hypothetical protein